MSIHEILPQSVGILAFLIGLYTYQIKNELKFKGILSLATMVYSMHFFLMGANTAAVSTFINSIRTLVSIKTKLVIVALFFIVIAVVTGVRDINHPMEILPIVSTVISTWALFRISGIRMRCVLWVSSFFWVIHNIWLGSVGGTMIESLNLFMNGMFIYRNRMEFNNKAY